ncbi:hypothetical protein BKA70DRAFT_1126820 [Coprinopsis sp. MPI-PUGE-AT-0042]|nr:hypothetical protein BKA70DRAFT_1126820 [Coprinopsis sp. MPI-PUGE-AT-0042]
MPNHEGTNQWGEKNYPSDQDLEAFLRIYAERGLMIREKLSCLKKDLNFSIGKSKLNEYERQFKIPTVRRPYMSQEEIDGEIASMVARDTAQGSGPVTIKSMLKNKGVMAGRDHVREIMHLIAPEGFDKRFPGRNKKVLERVPLVAIGPFHEISGDGHEKLNAQALQMGDLTLPVYAWRDKWSGFVLKIIVLPDTRKAAVIGHAYLDLIEEYGAIPIQLTLDKGSETGWEIAIQDALRRLLAPEIDPETDATAMSMKSVHNTIIESLWKWFKLKFGLNLKEAILKGKVDHIFNPQIPYHSYLFYWIFIPLIQEQLNMFQTYWNQHRVRHQADKVMPSGHIPADAFEHLDLHNPNAVDCRIGIPKDVQADCRRYLEEEVGMRKEHLTWFDDDFSEAAQRAYELAGCPELTMSSGWDAFQVMAGFIGDMYGDD